jgi:hypothetical protein
MLFSYVGLLVSFINLSIKADWVIIGIFSVMGIGTILSIQLLWSVPSQKKEVDLIDHLID